MASSLISIAKSPLPPRLSNTMERSLCLTLPQQTYFPLHSVIKFTFILWLLKRENSKHKRKVVCEIVGLAAAEAEKITVQTDFLACLFYYAVDVLSAHRVEAQQVTESRRNFLNLTAFQLGLWTDEKPISFILIIITVRKSEWTVDFSDRK